MKRIAVGIALLLMAGCSTLGSLPGTGSNAQQATVIMTVLAGISSYQANGCIPAVAMVDPAVACAPTTATDQTSINNAINACLAATATQLVLAQVKLPKCQVVAVPPPAVVVVPGPPTVPKP